MARVLNLEWKQPILMNVTQRDMERKLFMKAFVKTTRRVLTLPIQFAEPMAQVIRMNALLKNMGRE